MQCLIRGKLSLINTLDNEYTDKLYESRMRSSNPRSCMLLYKVYV